MNYTGNNSHLRNFFVSHLHNFWPEMYGSWENALDEMCATATIAYLKEVRSELNIIIHKGHSEHGLKRIIYDDLGANFNPIAAGFTYQQWLEKVFEIVGAWVQRKSK